MALCGLKSLPIEELNQLFFFPQRELESPSKKSEFSQTGVRISQTGLNLSVHCCLLYPYIITDSRLPRCLYLLHMLWAFLLRLYHALVSLRYCSSRLCGNRSYTSGPPGIPPSWSLFKAPLAFNQTICILFIVGSVILPSLKLSNTC